MENPIKRPHEFRILASLLLPSKHARRCLIPPAGMSLERGHSSPVFSILHSPFSILLCALCLAASILSDTAVAQQETANKHLLTIHYHRFDGDYDGAGIWTWDEARQRPSGNEEIFPAGRDEFGLIFKLDLREYGGPQNRIGLLPRMHQDWSYKDGGDRYWSSALGRDVYLVEGRSEVYSSIPDISPRLLGARLDDVDTIVLRFTHSISAPSPKDVAVRGDAGHTCSVRAVTPIAVSPTQKSRSFLVRLERPLDIFERTYEIEVRGFDVQRVGLGSVLASERFHDPEAKLGVSYASAETTFRLFSPMADTVDVVVANAPRGPDGATAHRMAKNEYGVWSATVPGDQKGRYYAYKLSGPGLHPQREAVDVSATCAQGSATRAMIVDLNATNPPGFDPSAYVQLSSPVDAVVYEVHVRDFSIAANSGIEHRGKYLGFSESGAHLPGDPVVRTGLDHLAELGVTHVHLLPTQDYENDEGTQAYNWGYITSFFNTPEGSYATTPAGAARIREFKQMVHALHQRGIGVVMDVVYNHTSSQATFELVAPGYYFRMKADGSFWNGSGCGNEVASEHPMVRKFIVDSLAYWMTEFGVDGFRFDLMALTDLQTMHAIRDRLRRINPSVLLYGEPWAGGASGLNQLTGKEQIRGSGIAAFNDHFRDAIKGERNGGAPGFIQNGERIERIRQGICAAVFEWALNPTDVVTYCAAHDNLVTWDKIVQAAPDAPHDLRKRMQRFAGLLVLTSQGMPFLHAGQELCRSKGGHHNSYNAPDSVNRIDWSLKQSNRNVFAYYQGLIALRQAHPAFRLRTKGDVERRLRFLEHLPGARCLAYALDGSGLKGETCSTILVLLNGDGAEQTFALPPGRWQVFANADRAGTAVLYETSQEMKVKAHSGAVLARLE
ncbi:MAG: type I pullulanase [bacterium]|nr:type I pullulanase [bacterium]